MANHAFAGAPWRVRRRLPERMRPALRRGRAAPRRALASPAVAYDVVIAGGGFGGLYAARRLERRLPRHSARITARQRRQLPALHAAAARRGRRLARAAPRGRAAARGARVDRHPARARHRRRPGARRAPRPHGRRPRRDAPLRPADRGARLGVARAAGARAGRARRSASRRSPTRSRCATARCSTSRSPSRCPTTRSRRAYLTFVFVGAGYAGLEGIAELQDYVADVIERYPRCRMVGHALHARRGARPRDARDPRRASPSSPRASCAGAAWRSAPAPMLDSVDDELGRRSRRASASRPALSAGPPA